MTIIGQQPGGHIGAISQSHISHRWNDRTPEFLPTPGALYAMRHPGHKQALHVPSMAQDGADHMPPLSKSARKECEDIAPCTLGRRGVTGSMGKKDVVLCLDIKEEYITLHSWPPERGIGLGSPSETDFRDLFPPFFENF